MHFHTGTINNKHIQPLNEFSLNEEYKIYHKRMDFPNANQNIPYNSKFSLME